jgi:hypothetical protein
MSDLSKLINECIAAKAGNKEFALFFAGKRWRAEIGNRSQVVSLGEVPGEFAAAGRTAKDAVSKLLAKLQATSK